ncbi:MAG: DMP19 family protein [Prevotella sp.]|nr:DMP19 family protein [Prevotella sp.]
MIEVKIKDAMLQKAANEGMDEFLNAFVLAIKEAIGGELTAETMAQLNSDQITLLAWSILHDEVMDGGYVQLIYNGYGGFIFKNPFAVAVRNWGLQELCRHIRKIRPLYDKYHDEIEQNYTNEEFMALFERMPEFDRFDDEFVENEELWTDEIAHFVDNHIENFVTIES